MPDFSVDVNALVGVAQALTGALDELAAHRVKDIDCAAGAFGHDRLAATVGDFCDRWHRGVEHLTTDGRQIAELLLETGQTYEQADGAATQVLQDAAAGLDIDAGGSVGWSAV